MSASAVLAAEADSRDTIADTFQGGTFCTDGFTALALPHVPIGTGAEFLVTR